ncbi:MAG: hypothetical protein WA324_19875 [Bryobacteraceae bacterium]
MPDEPITNAIRIDVKLVPVQENMDIPGLPPLTAIPTKRLQFLEDMEGFVDQIVPAHDLAWKSADMRLQERVWALLKDLSDFYHSAKPKQS